MLAPFQPGWNFTERAGGSSGSAGFPAIPMALAEESFAHGGSYGDLRQALQDNDDVMYVAAVEVGTPPRTVRLIVDTGSSDLWVAQGTYNPEHSSTVTHLKGEAFMQYGQGSVIGEQVKDHVCLSTDLCIDDQNIVEADQVSGIGNAVGAGGMFDGLLGLAFPSLSEAGGVPLLQRLIESNRWPHLAFGLSLRYAQDVEESSLNFGNLAEVLAEAPADARDSVELPVWNFNGQSKFWLVSTSITIAGNGQSHKALGILDSGTSLIAAPASAYAWIVNSVLPRQVQEMCGGPLQWHGQALCPCNIATAVQPLTFTFQSEHGKSIAVVLGAEDLLLPSGEEATYSDGVSVDLCRFVLQPAPPTLPFFILGDAFLRKVYAVHDVKAAKVVLFNRDSVAAAGANFAGVPVAAVAPLALLTTAVAAIAVAVRWRRPSGREAEHPAADYSRL